ncbi:hypothetical protein [Flavobacterium sp.]|uniref:hypothetical protein n=1 Tax=Flavobacterium sp. TaxID=239 RepID=UPI004033B8AA
MKIITKAFFDGKFISREEAKAEYLNRFPEPQEIANTISQLKSNSSTEWGYIVLISDEGISTSPITEEDLTIDY